MLYLLLPGPAAAQCKAVCPDCPVSIARPGLSAGARAVFRPSVCPPASQLASQRPLRPPSRASARRASARRQLAPSPLSGFQSPVRHPFALPFALSRLAALLYGSCTVFPGASCMVLVLYFRAPAWRAPGSRPSCTNKSYHQTDCCMTCSLFPGNKVQEPYNSLGWLNRIYRFGSKSSNEAEPVGASEKISNEVLTLLLARRSAR
jgi:hypothetical protein